MSRIQEDPRGEPESTTLLTLLPVLLSQPGAGFFFAFVLVCLPVCPREVFLVLRQMQNCLMRYAYQVYKTMPFCVGRVRPSRRIRHE
ncbi:hypothetical protein FFT88_02465 [Escherichia sp. E4930]|nr:hypothetical protein FFT88_02465 [Escherichia sp. E4930]